MELHNSSKCLSLMSQKLMSKDSPTYGLLSLFLKNEKVYLSVSNEKVSCSIPVDVKHNFTGELEFMLDGRLVSRVSQKPKSEDISLECIFNVENKPSSLVIHGNLSTEVSIPLHPQGSKVKHKRLSSSHLLVNKELLLLAMKSTVFAGSDVDSERPYYYALLKFDKHSMSFTCGNGSFFASLECKALSDSSESDFCLLPIPVVLSLIPILEECNDELIKISFDDNSVVMQSDCFRFSCSISRKCVSWPDASSIMNRKSGLLYNVSYLNIKEIASSIDMASEGYDSKNNTLKCQMTLSKDKLSVKVDGCCKINSSVNIESENETEKTLTIDAACIAASIKSKAIGDFVEINIDDSQFKGRPSPVVISSFNNNCSYKTFFAVV